MTIWYAVEDDVATRCGRPCYTGIRSSIRLIDPCRQIVRVWAAAPTRRTFVVLPSFIYLNEKFIVLDDDMVCRGRRRCDPLWMPLLYRNP